MNKHRDLSMDNIRAVLIFLVVLGHTLEIGPEFEGKQKWYLSIYFFHIAAFLFVSGWFSRFRPGRTVWCVIWPYVLFQSAYILFDCAHYGWSLPVQYTTPYWLMWYLMALAFLQLLIPVYDRATVWGRGLVLCASIALALCAGYWDGIGYELTLSRFFAFQPWFVLGLYCSGRRHPGKWGYLWGIGGLVLALYCGQSLLSQKVTPLMLYCTYPYSVLQDGPGIRGLVMLTALGAVGALMGLLRPLLDRKIPLLTAVGQNTLSVYLLHGFAMRLIAKFLPGFPGSLPASILTALALVLVLGCPPIGKAMGFVLSDKWWKWLKERIDR